MTRAVLALIPVAAAAAALLGSQVAPAPAAVIGVVLGGATAFVAWSVHDRRVAGLARSVNRWLGTERHDPVQLPATRAWQQLAVALNALGADFDRRGRRLDRSRRLREELVAALHEPAFLFGPDGRLIRANIAARSDFGVPTGAPTPAQALGSAQLATAVDEAREVGRSVHVEARMGERDLEAIAAPVGNEVLLLVLDRTERRLVDAVRRDFVANASHELKTPVAGIQAVAEALTVTIDRDPERARSLAGRLAGEAERLGKLVRDLLDLRRLEEGLAHVSGPVDLVELVRDEVARVEPAAEDRRVAVDVDVPDAAVVEGVDQDLRLIVANLLDNAIGYNRPGGRVAVRLRAVDGQWELAVSDTGIGIARQDLDRIFERFYRVDVARSRASGGTGLGLSIVRHATERHGGRVSVQSVLGEGTSITVTLPVERGAE